jgi:hypothetical protein
VVINNDVYERVKREYPDIPVGTPGFEFWEEQGTLSEDCLRGFFGHDPRPRFDVFAFHPYPPHLLPREDDEFVPLCTTCSHQENPLTDQLQAVEKIRSLLEEAGYHDVSILDTEAFGYVFGAVEGDESKRAVWTAQRYVLSRSLVHDGFFHLTYSNFYNAGLQPFDFGLWGSDWQPRETLSAYLVTTKAIREFPGYLGRLSGTQGESEVWVEVFINENSERLFVLFNPQSDAGEVLSQAEYVLSGLTPDAQVRIRRLDGTTRYETTSNQGTLSVITTEEPVFVSETASRCR